MSQKYEGELQRKVTTYESTLQNYTRENEELRRRLQELNELTRKVSEYENKIALLAQELERLNEIVRQKDGQNEHLKRTITEQY